MRMIKNISKICYFISMCLLILAFLTACGTKDTITFSAEIKSVSDNSILVKTIDFETFDKASVDLSNAEYDFELSEGQIIDITILPEIKESYPVQVTGVRLVLQEDVVKNAADYFPIKENTKYIYKGIGNEFASYQVFNDYCTDNRVQQRVDNGGSALVNVYEISDGKIARVFFKGEVYHRSDFLDERNNAQEILLMEPLKKGTSWNLPDGRVRSITKVNTEVDTPMEKFEAIEVTTEGNDGITIDYYAIGTGLVKTVYQANGMEVSSSLKSIEENSTNTQMIQFYFPDLDSEKIYYKTKGVLFKTNDSTDSVLEEAYKEAAGESLGDVFTTNTAIRSLTLDDENIVRLDLNSAFMAEMNAGTAYEAAILQSITNTFCLYYNAEELILTVEGKPYESGHIMMEKNQSISANYEGITEKK